MSNYGFLAIWTDIEAEHFQEYRHWLSREHIGQRIFGTGFLGARVHAAANNELSHFILYATTDKHVLRSTEYLHVLNNPTTWTKRMMPRLRNFDRGAGEQVAKVGDGSGAWIVVSRLAAGLPMPGELGERLALVLNINGVATVRLYTVDQQSTDIPSTEKTMRAGGEGVFRSLLVIEAMTQQAAIAAEHELDRIVTTLFGSEVPHDCNCYRFVYALHAFERATVMPTTSPG